MPIFRSARSDPKSFGTRTEVKNLNSFRAVEQALNYEAERQARILAGGGEVVQATCHWDDSSQGLPWLCGKKEGAADYRYFPEPDLPPLMLERSFIEAMQGAASRTAPPETQPPAGEQYGSYSPKRRLIITGIPARLADFFEAAAGSYR
jgi:aspartyl-tRNA(Asn)/glutamyl-tRNA(Gln) amidotransferase subunit B